MILGFKRRLSVVLAVAVICALVLPAMAQDAVVARVGSVPITLYELGRQLQRLIPLQGSYHSGVKPEKVAELREQALEQLIEQAYLVQYAYSEELAVKPDEIDAMIKPIRARYKTSEQFVAALGQESEKEFRASAARHLLAKKALQKAVVDRVKVDEEALKSDFEKNRHKYVRPRQFRASHILIKVDPAMTADEKAKQKEFVQSLYDKAVAGEDFYDLAYHNSQDRTAMVGGDVGYFHLGQLDKDVEAEIIHMKVGDISKPIRTFYGYEIVKLVEDNPEKQLAFDDVRQKLVAAERETQTAKLKAELLEMLRAKYPVERLVKS